MSTQGQWRGDIDGLWYGADGGGGPATVNLAATLTGAGVVTAGLTTVAADTPTTAGRPHPFAQHFPRIAIPHRRPRSRRQADILFL